MAVDKLLRALLSAESCPRLVLLYT